MQLLLFFRKEESSVGSFPELEIIKPDELAGDYLESVSSKVNWTPEFLKKVQQEKRYGEHVGACGGNTGRTKTGPIKYPQVPDYVPPNVCETGAGEDDENTGNTAAGPLAISSFSIVFAIAVRFYV